MQGVWTAVLNGRGLYFGPAVRYHSASMDHPGIASAGIIFTLLLFGGFVLMAMLIVAPLKLYGIHREIRYTNDLLKHQCGLLEQLIGEQSRAQAGVIAAISWQRNTGGSPSATTGQ